MEKMEKIEEEEKKEEEKGGSVFFDETELCLQCGRGIKSETRFCPYCGLDLYACNYM